MRPPESFIGQPIRSLQTMLRVIAENDPSHERIIPDGIYGPETLSAVSTFQRIHGLPTTGVTDQDTWDAIVDIYEPALIRIGPAQPLEIILEPGEIIRRGDRQLNVYVLQAVLIVLSNVYSSITPPGMNGVLDEATATSLEAFQALSGLPQTGELDKVTWKNIVRQFTLNAHHNEARRLKTE